MAEQPCGVRPVRGWGTGGMKPLKHCRQRSVGGRITYSPGALECIMGSGLPASDRQEGKVLQHLACEAAEALFWSSTSWPVPCHNFLAAHVLRHAQVWRLGSWFDSVVLCFLIASWQHMDEGVLHSLEFFFLWATT